MTGPVNLNPNEVKVLAALATVAGDFGYLSFKGIGRRVRLKRAVIRLACRSLTRKGLAKFGSGLWTEDDGPGGSGYAATETGCLRADRHLVDKIELRMWP